MTYLFFDTETTGLPKFYKEANDSCQPRICQLGAILTDKEGRVKAEINLLVKPEGYEISPELSAIHGITQEDAMKYGLSAKGVLSIFDRLLCMAETVVAHNVKFDLFMLKIESALSGVELHVPLNPYCTIEASKDILKIPPTAKMMAANIEGYKSPNLQEAHEHFFNRKFEGAHDAMADVRACRDVFFAIQDAKAAV